MAAAISALLALVLATTLDWPQLIETLRLSRARPDLIVIMLVAYTLAFALRAFAWKSLLTAPTSTGALFTILQTSLFLNHLLPLKAGEVARPFSRRALDIAEIIHDYNYAQVLTLDLLHKGMRMIDVPITYRRRRRGRSFIGSAYLWRVPAGMMREMLSR